MIRLKFKSGVYFAWCGDFPVIRESVENVFGVTGDFILELSKTFFEGSVPVFDGRFWGRCVPDDK